MAGRQNQPDWRSAAGGPDRKGKQHGWQQEDPGTNVRSGTRRFKMLFLIGGGCAAAAGIVWLILLLMPGKRPGFLAIAANPRVGVTRLDMPYDPYGWLSAKRLLNWMTEAGKTDDRVPKVLAENPMWLDDQLDEWVEKVGADSNVDPVIVYIGLHGGVNSDGHPILYTGRDEPSPLRESDRPAVQLSKILTKLDERAPTQRKVVILDTGRALPDPNIGEISNDFARAVKVHLGETIAKMTTMTVILSSNSGERAWDSAQLGTTALTDALLQSLAGTRGGSVGRDNMSSYRADELFVALKTDVEQWSRSQRPTPQTPQILPPLEDWRADANRMARYSERKFFKPRDGTIDPRKFAPERSPGITKELEDEWNAAATLAARRPSPATYTPVAWRRYRELLLRYERAVLAGDTDGAGVLMGTIAATRGDIERGLDLTLDSIDSLVPLRASFGMKPTRSLDEVANAPNLTDAAARTRTAIGNAQRPIEAHLPIMLNFYARDVLKSPSDGTLASAWKPAVATRLLAERAALGVGADDGFPYSERVWPLVAPTILAADEARRRGEDRLHGEADQVAGASDDFKAADKKYRDALEIAARIQEPLQLRDAVFADLPFFARWLPEADEIGSSNLIAAENESLRELWKQAMVLSLQIERIPNEPAALTSATAAVRERMTNIKKLIDNRARVDLASDAASNLTLAENLLLLPPPLLSAADRRRIIERARDIAAKLAEPDTKRVPFVGDVESDPEKVIRRQNAIAESLGGEWADWIGTQLDVPKVQATLKKSDSKLFDNTPKVMGAFAAQRRRQADFAKHPDGGPVERARAELFSRLAVPYEQFPNPEPATLAARRRWKVLLEAEAHRVALDHWYNENGVAYFTAQYAPQFLEDARKISKKLGEQDVPKSADETETERLIAVKPLSLKCLDAADTAIRWTTESERTLRYALQTTPYGVPGLGVLSWKTDEQELLDLNVATRRLVDLRLPVEGGGPRIKVMTGPRIEDAATQARTTRIKASGYFRGQRLAMQQTTDVRINRRPDLVVSAVKSKRDAALAIRTDRDFSPGAVSILLDYSASMSYDWGEEKISKKIAMIDVLQELLDKKLPYTTDLKVHAFLAENKKEGDKIESEVIFDHETNPDFKGFLKKSNGLIDTLRKKATSGNTPLLESMRETIKAMKNNYLGNKTLIVLTDGADTTFVDLIGGYKPVKEMTGDEKQTLIKAVHRELQEFERESGLLIQIIIFGENQDEKDLAEQMFRPIRTFERTPGSVIIANTKKDLIEQLADAIRPKPRLVFRNGSTLPTDTTNVPISGIPTNQTDEGPGQITWRGPLRPDAYQLRHYRTDQNIDVATGDALSVRLRRDPNGRSFFHREIFYRDVDRTLSGDRIDNGHPDWHLAVPEFGRGSATYAYLLTTAALESKIGTEATDQSNGDVESQTTIRQTRPAFAWWELTRVNRAGREERFPGPVSIHNLEGRYAPSWRIAANNGANFDGLDTGSFVLRSWIRANDVPIFGTRTLQVTLDDLRAGITETIQDVTVRATIEKMAFTDDNSLLDRLPATLREPGTLKGIPVDCVVVRVDDPNGRRFQVRLDPRFKPDCAEHRYFYEPENADAVPKIMAYTAVFGEANADNLANLGPIVISLISVSEIKAAAEGRNKPLEIKLRNPQSQSASPMLAVPQKPDRSRR